MEDHALLENLHTVVADKFKELAAATSSQNSEMAALKAKHAVLNSFFLSLPLSLFLCRFV